MLKYIKILFLVFFYSCSDKHKLHTTDLISVCLEEFNKADIHIEDVCSEIEIIPLESHEECLIKEYPSIYVTEKYIIINNDFSDAFLFDRQTGVFIHKIGNRGNGPDEYISTLSNSFIEEENILFFDKGDKWIGIDIETNQVRKILNLPKGIQKNLFNKFMYCPINGCFKYDSINYISFVNNISGNDTIKLVIFNSNGDIVKTFPNYDTYPKLKQNQYPSFTGCFYKYNDLLFFKEPTYNDTIFKVLEDELKPSIIFELGKRSPPYKERESSDFDMKNYISIAFTRETERFIFFRFATDRIFYYGYYDKVVQKQSVCQGGFKYIENNLPPFEFWTDTKNGELVGLYSASTVIKYINDNPNFPYDEKLLNLQEDDNPVLVIAKPKNTN